MWERVLDAIEQNSDPNVNVLRWWVCINQDISNKTLGNIILTYKSFLKPNVE